VDGQVRFEADFIETRSRPSTFFRWLLIIPLYFWAAIYSIAVEFAVLFAWFGLLFTGRYPQGLYEFVAGYIRFLGRAAGYAYLMTDEYAPFSGSGRPDYPVRVEVAPPLDRYGRWRVFLRVPIIILALPVVYLLSGLFFYLASVPWVSWIVIVNDGKARQSLQRLTWMYIAFTLRAQAYLFLMSQDFPPFFSEWSRTAVAAGAPASPPSPPPAPPAPPAAPAA
jgi:hypothetical protein